MREPSSAVRDHLVRVLDWEDAHVGFDRAVDGIPPDRRGARAAGFEHSPWQLLEHLRIAQEDILDFCVHANYEHRMTWPDDYWPKEGREAMKQLVRDVDDLTTLVPTGRKAQTYLRAIVLAADHAAYHVGQLVAVRRALAMTTGCWR